MTVNIKAKEGLFVNEWQLWIMNDCDYDIVVDLGHNDLMVKTVTVKDKTEIPDVFKGETE